MTTAAVGTFETSGTSKRPEESRPTQQNTKPLRCDVVPMDFRVVTSTIRRQRQGVVAFRNTRVLGYTALITCNITVHCTDRTVNRAASAGSTSVHTVTRPAATLETLQQFKNVISLSYVQLRPCCVEHNTRPFIFLDSATKSLVAIYCLPSTVYRLLSTVYRLLPTVYRLLPQRTNSITVSPDS